MGSLCCVFVDILADDYKIQDMNVEAGHEVTVSNEATDKSIVGPGPWTADPWHCLTVSLR